MTELFAAVCSIAPTRRRRFLWAAWWTAPPEREPFRKPDAYAGGARSREEALREAERAAGRSLVEIEPRWARAWARVLMGQAAWLSSHTDGDVAPAATAPAARGAPAGSIWAVLGLEATASVDEIKRAFRSRALETHPDKGGNAETFRELRRAYEEALARRAKPRARKR